MRPPGAECRSPLPPASGCCWLYTCVSSLCLGCCSSPARRYGALCPALPGSSLPGAPQCRPRRSTGRSLALLLCTPLRWRPLRPAVRAAPLSPCLFLQRGPLPAWTPPLSAPHCFPAPSFLLCGDVVCVTVSMLCVCFCLCVYTHGGICVCVCVTVCAVCVFYLCECMHGGVCVCVSV